MTIDQIETPALLIDGEILHRNLRTMAEYCGTHHLSLRPHIKTHKLPQIAKMQVGHGATGITVAKLGEAEVMVEAGLDDIVVVYPVWGESKWRRLTALAEEARIAVTMDSLAIAEEISKRAAQANVEVGIRLEFDTGFGRCGLPLDQSSAEIARRIRDLPHLRWEGISFYPGHIMGDRRSREKDIQAENRQLDRLFSLLDAAGIPYPVVSGGNTPAAFESHRFHGVTEIRPGTYVFNDRNTVDAEAATFNDCAATVLTTVVSTSVQQRAIIAGLTDPLPQFNMYPNIVLSNFALWGDGFPGYFPVTAPDSVEQYEDTFSKVAGRHTLSFGADLDFWQTKGVTDPVQANGQFSFDGQFSSLAGEIPDVSSVSDLADMELGYPSGGEFTKNAIVTNLVGGRWISAFAQDSFHAVPRFTLQYGLRWEYRRQPMDTHNQIATLFPMSKSYTPGDAFLLTALPDAANDALCSNPYFISASGQCLIMTSAARRAHGLTGNKVRQVSYGPGAGYFAPRLGLSWQPTASDRLVVHTGAGIFMDLPDTNRMGSFANNNPVFTQTPNYVAPFGAPPPITNGAPTTTQNVFQNAPLVSLAGITSQLMPSPFYKTPETYEWSLSVQYQIAPQWGSEVAYIGNHGVHLDYMFNTGNQPKPGVGDLQPRRPWPDFGPMLYDDYEGASKYQAVYGKLEKRASHGFAAMISYTFANSTDNEGGNIDNQSTIQNYNDPNADYGASDYDVRHTFVASPVYQLPFGSGQRFAGGRVFNALAGGWQANAIISASSGLPFTVRSNQDYSNTDSPSPRPDRTCKASGPKKLDEWFDPSCFTTAALAQDFANGNPRFGNSGRNILRQPGMQNWDIGLTKKMNLREGFVAEFKGEFFNAFNHTNWGPPGAVIGSSTVGIISSQAGSPRNVQLAVKIDF